MNQSQLKRLLNVLILAISLVGGVDCFSPAPAFWGSSSRSSSVVAAVQIQMRATASNNNQNDWNDKHLVHGAENIHEETNEELLEAEELAAIDAHDLSDPGMEAAAEERAVMMAHDVAKALKESLARNQSPRNKRDQWNEEHLQYHEETNEELLEAEELAAIDAHDLSDAGMEAAAEERAVMMAQEMVRKIKKKADKAKRGFRNDLLDDDE